MKRALLLTAVTLTLFTSCINTFSTIREEESGITLSQLVSTYDIWYVDYNSKSGSGNVPFLSNAFTISFLNGSMYANNNLAGIGKTGEGYGIKTGNYNTFDNVISIYHSKYGKYNLQVVQLSKDKIRLVDNQQNTSYDLEGYQKRYFNFDKVFYDNLEYFLQEYDVWAKTFTSKEGKTNAFDNENFLGFTSENNTTFYSSKNDFGTNVDYVKWNYKGSYEVADIQNHENLKFLTLFYENNEKEEFEVSVIDDANLQFYHIDSKTVYKFQGVGFIRYLRPEKNDAKKSKKERTRFKTYRKTVMKK